MKIIFNKLILKWRENKVVLLSIEVDRLNKKNAECKKENDYYKNLVGDNKS